MKNENTNHYSHHIGHRYGMAFLLHRLGRWVKAIFHRANRCQNCPYGKDAAQPSSKRTEVLQQQLDDNIRELEEKKGELEKKRVVIDWLKSDEMCAKFIALYPEASELVTGEERYVFLESFQKQETEILSAIIDLEAEIAAQKLIIDAL